MIRESHSVEEKNNVNPYKRNVVSVQNRHPNDLKTLATDSECKTMTLVIDDSHVGGGINRLEEMEGLNFNLKGWQIKLLRLWHDKDEWIERDDEHYDSFVLSEYSATIFIVIFSFKPQVNDSQLKRTEGIRQQKRKLRERRMKGNPCHIFSLFLFIQLNSMAGNFVWKDWQEEG